MFWLFIPAIYFYIGPCMGLMQNLAPPRMRAMFTAWSLLVGNVFNLIIAPQGVGFLSDWFAGARGVERRLAALGAAGARAHRILGGLAFLYLRGRTIVADQSTRSRLRDRRDAQWLMRDSPHCLVCWPALWAVALMPQARRPTSSVLNDDAHYPGRARLVPGQAVLRGVRSQCRDDLGRQEERGVLAAKRAADSPPWCPPPAANSSPPATTTARSGAWRRTARCCLPIPTTRTATIRRAERFRARRARRHLLHRLGPPRPEAIDGKVFYIAADGIITEGRASAQRQRHGGVQGRQDPVRGRDRREPRCSSSRSAPSAHCPTRRIFVNLDDLTNHVVHIWPDGVKIDSHGRSTSARARATSTCRWRA